MDTKEFNQERPYTFERYPYPGDPTWQAWNTADRYAWQYVEEHFPQATSLALYHDRFGVLATLWAERAPRLVLTHASQRAALQRQWALNAVPQPLPHLQSLLQPWAAPVHLAVIQVPKSWDLLTLYLEHLAGHLTTGGTVVLSFMTRHFSPQLLTVCSRYFGHVKQSRAWKKARLIILTHPKIHRPHSLMHTLTYQGRTFRQHYGVFSAQRIDHASQMLLEHTPAPAPHSKGLDIACGNGVLGLTLQGREPSSVVTYIDDFELAIASTLLNVPEGIQAAMHWNYHLHELPAQGADWAVCNPPFHQGYETTTALAHGLFVDAARCLKPAGTFWVVANRHLKYDGVLRRYFGHVQRFHQDRRFILYQCTKSLTE